MLLIVVTVLFGLWFILTILWQIERWRERSRLLRMTSILHVLPIWTFFAPRPGMSDMHVLYRDKTATGTSPWREVELGEERTVLHWLWNPRKRLDKLAVDAVSEVKSIKIRADEVGLDDLTIQQQVKLSKGYLILLNMVFKHAKLDPSSRARQLAVVEGNQAEGERTLSPIFFSPFHAFSE